MEIPNPTLYNWENWTASFEITGHLVAALLRQTEFKTGYHAMLLWDGLGGVWCRHVQYAQTALEEAIVASPALYAHQLQWGTKTLAWLTVSPSTANGTKLGGQD